MTTLSYTKHIILALTSMSLLWFASRRFFCTMATEQVKGLHSAAFVTCPDKDVATKLARGLVEKDLVACVNIIPGLTSVYKWQGKVEEDSEVLMMIKTRTAKIPEVSAYVRENHPYDVAEVISVQIDQGNPPYLQWISDSVPS
ncbi:protein CutA homolog [Glandiceps talaboti]